MFLRNTFKREATKKEIDDLGAILQIVHIFSHVTRA
jgi:hypothetical protein